MQQHSTVLLWCVTLSLNINSTSTLNKYQCTKSSFYFDPVVVRRGARFLALLHGTAGNTVSVPV